MFNVHIRLIRDGEKGGRGYGGGWRGRLYTYRYTVTTGMTPALRWAAMRAILMFHNCEGQSHKTASTDHNFWRERRAEADSNRSPPSYQPNVLLLGHTGSQTIAHVSVPIYIPQVLTTGTWRAVQFPFVAGPHWCHVLLAATWFPSCCCVA